MLLSLETSFMFVKVLMRIKYATSDLDDAQLKSKMYFVLQQEVVSMIKSNTKTIVVSVELNMNVCNDESYKIHAF